MALAQYQDDDPAVRQQLMARLAYPQTAAPVTPAAPTTRLAPTTAPFVRNAPASRLPPPAVPAVAVPRGTAGTAPTTTPPPVTPAPSPVTPAPFNEGTLQQALQALPANGQSVQQVLAAHPEWNVQSLGGKGDKVRLPDGRVIDVGFSFGDPAHSRWQWLEETGGGQPQAAAAPANSQTSLAASASNPWLEQIRALLMDRLTRASQGVDPNDPSISEPLNAARNEASRENTRQRTEMAERLYAEGDLNSNSLSQGLQQSSERTAIGLGTFRGQLIQQEYERHRQELGESLQMALASGDAQMAREIQLQLSYLNAQIQREQFDVTRDGYRNQRDIAEAQFNQNAVTTGRG